MDERKACGQKADQDAIALTRRRFVGGVGVVAASAAGAMAGLSLATASRLGSRAAWPC